eukprot:TRINITY_DN13389_c0_g1_i7.p1 TRINITY_DN13389_c0_g1~~TRINITY_DN13389_c0_g1_i7.p1  ORF type:complete len:349 (-),score=74.92 TRINITY_DN13389_c0_g1_i7:433-1479(-)
MRDNLLARANYGSVERKKTVNKFETPQPYTFDPTAVLKQYTNCEPEFDLKIKKKLEDVVERLNAAEIMRSPKVDKGGIYLRNSIGEETQKHQKLTPYKEDNEQSPNNPKQLLDHSRKLESVVKELLIVNLDKTAFRNHLAHEIKEIQNTLKETHNNITALTKEKAETKEQLYLSQAKVKKLNSACKVLQAKLESNRLHENNNGKAKNDHEDIVRENAQLKRSLLDVEMKFSTLKKENDAARRLHEENADLRLLLKETHDGLESLSVDMKPLKPKMNGLQSDNSALYQIIEDIRKKLHHHLANSKELKENQAKNYRSNLDVIENKRLKDDIRKLQDENAKLKVTLCSNQ